jgi:hypothetical protein
MRGVKRRAWVNHRKRKFVKWLVGGFPGGCGVEFRLLISGEWVGFGALLRWWGPVVWCFVLLSTRCLAMVSYRSGVAGQFGVICGSFLGVRGLRRVPASLRSHKRACATFWWCPDSVQASLCRVAGLPMVYHELRGSTGSRARPGRKGRLCSCQGWVSAR